MKLTVNGTPHDVSAPPDTPLLWVLRDDLGMTGTKFGCGRGLCGSCTVLANGDPIRSCSTAVADVAGKKIVTIEGLSPALSHPLQKAWIAENVPQCGYCQAGQIMSAAGLLMKTKKPTDADIDEAMNGNLCRCGTYQRIRRAIHAASTVILSGENKASSVGAPAPGRAAEAAAPTPGGKEVTR